MGTGHPERVGRMPVGRDDWDRSLVGEYEEQSCTKQEHLPGKAPGGMIIPTHMGADSGERIKALELKERLLHLLTVSTAR